MKLPLAFLVLSTALPAFLHAGEKTVMRDAATHEDLVKKLKSTETVDPMKRMKASSGADPSKKNQPEDILNRVDFICFNGAATLVPKRAIISVPENLKSRLILTSNTPITHWPDFYIRNRGWITTIEVSRAQAEGKEPFPAETTERIAQSTNLVIAMFQGSPISVLPLKTPPVETTGPIKKP
ncbi:MAG: hypothetical protein V4733_04930 [Verrucomicrobiota bacterium]